MMQRRRAVAWVASIVWMGVIFALSALPGSSLPGRFSGLGHFTVYAVLGLLYCAALGERRPWWQALAIAVALASLYGVTDEFHQSFVPGRTPDPLDWLVDTVGAAIGAGIFTLLARRLSSRSARRPC